MEDFTTQQTTPLAEGDSPTSASDFDPFFGNNGDHASNPVGWHSISGGFIPLYHTADNGPGDDDDFSQPRSLQLSDYDSRPDGIALKQARTASLGSNYADMRGGDAIAGMRDAFAQPRTLQLGGGTSRQQGYHDFTQPLPQGGGTSQAPTPASNPLSPVDRWKPVNNDQARSGSDVIGDPGRNPGPQGGPGTLNGHTGTYGPIGNTPTKSFITDLVGNGAAITTAALTRNAMLTALANALAKYGMNALLQNGQSFTGDPHPVPPISGYHGPPSGRGR